MAFNLELPEPLTGTQLRCLIKHVEGKEGKRAGTLAANEKSDLILHFGRGAHFRLKM